MEVTTQMVRKVSGQICCSLPLTRDLLILAGGDADLVIEASEQAEGIGQLKALIIDGRIKREKGMM